MRPTHRPLFLLKSFARFVPAVTRAGFVSAEGGPRAALALAPNLARYWFTTAREVEQGAAAAPDRIALIDDTGVLTYRQLRDDSRTLAKWLLDVKEERGLDELRIGVMARNGRGIILPLAAKGYAGAHIFLLNIGSSPEQLAGIFAENDINVLFIDDEFADRLPAGTTDTAGITVVRAHEDGGAGLSIGQVVRMDVDRQLPRWPKHGNLVLMSSGTTGIPKGIVRPEPRMPFVVAGYLEAIPWRAGDTVQLTASIFHTWGWSALQVALATRSTIVTRRIFDPEACFRDIQKYRCDGLISSPIFFKQMLDLEESYDTSTLRYLASAGNAVTPSLLRRTTERFGPILANIYGSTELALAAAASPEQMQADPTTVGKIPPGTVLKLYDDHGNEVPPGETGRIFLHNETALRGYTNPATEMVEIDGLVEMGDLGYLDDRGYLHVQSRNDDMIIVGGENVHPQSVVEVLEDMPGVGEVYAHGVDDEQMFKRIAVWVVKSADLTADAVRDWVRAHLADHSIPRDVHFVDELPRNAVGKVVPRFLPGLG
ncbi:AMP-binding protein [Corynebacterium afermentans subsp. lipophilum]|uniref:AMP-binding protein n=1 Tax=Corynebacterium afermentans TaxID=38286 RepID=UPI00188AE496|nr:AMP-binding protein [Corynebacterium afermentans]MBF4547413.1 AMP-binding protein [Corynebacterium afermentans subsp. lipophilum]WJY57971.1 Long-chain-fatty-acid--CoA ligase [Corynebacterium afermentans subsp. lipophilum]